MKILRTSAGGPPRGDIVCYNNYLSIAYHAQTSDINTAAAVRVESHIMPSESHTYIRIINATTTDVHVNFNNILYYIMCTCSTDSRSQMEIHIFKTRLIRIIIIYVKIMRRPYIITPLQQHSRILETFRNINHRTIHCIIHQRCIFFFHLS